MKGPRVFGHSGEELISSKWLGPCLREEIGIIWVSRACLSQIIKK